MKKRAKVKISKGQGVDREGKINFPGLRNFFNPNGPGVIVETASGDKFYLGQI